MKMRRTFISRAFIAGALAAVLTAGVFCTSERGKPDIADAPTLVDAGCAVYSGIYDYPVRLTGGAYDGEPFVDGGAARPTVRLLTGLFGKGDLDGDGSEEAVVLLVENSGGSGSFIYMAVLSSRMGEVENIGSAPVGDRVQIRSMTVEGGDIKLDVVQQGPGDAACCPSQKARRSWVLEGDGLVERWTEVRGKISITDLDRVDWVFKQFDRNEPVSGDYHITLVIEDGRITGSSGCNRYFADITESSPGEIKVGEMGTTRMVCSDEIMLVENRYLSALDAVVRYGFLAGRLALTCKTGDRSTVLLYEAEQAPPEE